MGSHTRRTWPAEAKPYLIWLKQSSLADLIQDFNPEEGDTLDLSGVDAVAGGEEDAFTFIGNAAFAVADFTIAVRGEFALKTGIFIL
jgi:hypothetical protein